MKRIKSKQNQNQESETVTYDNTQEPIVLSKYTLDKILSQEKPSDLISLYTFYYYTAKWQLNKWERSGQTCRCTNTYIKNKFKWSENRILKNKKILLKLNLIEKIQLTDKKTNKFKTQLIKVNFLWSSEKTQNNKIAGPLKNGDPEKAGTKIDITDREKIDITDSPVCDSIQIKNKRFLPIAKALSKIIKTNKNINITNKQLSNWSNEIRKLNTSNKIPIRRMKEAVKWYKNNINKKYVPVIESGISFKNKFLKLENAMSRDSNYEPKNGYSGFKTKDQNPKATKHILSNFDLQDKNELIKNINNMQFWIKDFEDVLRKKDKNLLSRAPILIEIVRKYCNYLDDQKWIDNINSDLFNHKHKIFEKFISILEQDEFCFRFETGQRLN